MSLAVAPSLPWLSLSGVCAVPLPRRSSCLWACSLVPLSASFRGHSFYLSMTLHHFQLVFAAVLVAFFVSSVLFVKCVKFNFQISQVLAKEKIWKGWKSFPVRI